MSSCTCTRETPGATRELIDSLTSKTWDKIHEHLQYVYLQQQSPANEQILNRAVSGNHALLVKVLCAYTTLGCLVEAKQLALEQQNVDIARILDAYLASDVVACSLDEHCSSSDGDGRRCQRQDVKHPGRKG